MALNEDDDYMQDLKVRIYEKAEEGRVARVARVVRVEPRQSPSVPREVNVLHVLDAYFKFLGRRPRYYLVEARTGEWAAVVYVRGDIKGENMKAFRTRKMFTKPMDAMKDVAAIALGHLMDHSEMVIVEEKMRTSGTYFCIRVKTLQHLLNHLGDCDNYDDETENGKFKEIENGIDAMIKERRWDFFGQRPVVAFGWRYMTRTIQIFFEEFQRGNTRANEYKSTFPARMKIVVARSATSPHTSLSKTQFDIVTGIVGLLDMKIDAYVAQISYILGWWVAAFLLTLTESNVVTYFMKQVYSNGIHGVIERNFVAAVERGQFRGPEGRLVPDPRYASKPVLATVSAELLRTTESLLKKCTSQSASTQTGGCEDEITHASTMSVDETIVLQSTENAKSESASVQPAAGSQCQILQAAKASSATSRNILPVTHTGFAAQSSQQNGGSKSSLTLEGQVAHTPLTTDRMGVNDAFDAGEDVKEKLKQSDMTQLLGKRKHGREVNDCKRR
ncbi:hypothetical protein B0J14DRAFT_556728 [Halenospora varia]|nr:hypothetical protein B0J14DRAFT_556728 [Halenospora varia]